MKKVFLALLATMFLLSILASCTEEKHEIKEINVEAARQGTKYAIPNIQFVSNVTQNESRVVEKVEPFKYFYEIEGAKTGDTITYMDEDYELWHEEQYVRFSDAPEMCRQIFCENDDGEKYGIVFYDENKAPVAISYYDISGSDNSVDVETARNNALIFIEDVLNDDFDMDINIEQYEINDTENNPYRFGWALKCNGFLAHKIKINAEKSGEVEFFYAPPVPDEETIELMASLTDEKLNEIIKPVLDEMADDGFEIVIDEIRKEERIYLHEASQYGVSLTAFVRICSLDGKSEEDLWIWFFIPLIAQ